MSQKRTNCSGPGEGTFRPAHRNLTVKLITKPTVITRPANEGET